MSFLTVKRLLLVLDPLKLKSSPLLSEKIISHPEIHLFYEKEKFAQNGNDTL
jgi:hypothetical protein